MKSGFNYGVLFTVGGVAFIFAVGEIVLWYSRRAERRSGANGANASHNR